MVGVGELIGVVSGRADEVAVDADGLFLGVEIHEGDPKLAVCGAGGGAASGFDVEVGNGIAVGIDEAAGGWMGIVDMPVAAQRRWRAKRDLLVMPADGHEDGPDNQEGDGEDDFGDEDGNAPGATIGPWNPFGRGRGGLVAPEKATECEGVGKSEEHAAEEQVRGEQLDGDVEEEVVEDDVGHHDGGENGSGERRAAIKHEHAAEDLGGAADDLVDGVEPDEVPEQSHGRQVADRLVEDADRGWRHLEREDLSQSVTDHEHAAGEAEKEAQPGVEGVVLGARVFPEKRDEGPKDAAGESEGDEEAVLNPVHRGVAGFGGVPVCGDAGEMEEMLAGEFREAVNGPVELAFNPAARNGEGAEESSVAEKEDEAKEIAEGEAKAQAGGGVPWSGRSRNGRVGDRSGGYRCIDRFVAD